MRLNNHLSTSNFNMKKFIILNTLFFSLIIIYFVVVDYVLTYQIQRSDNFTHKEINKIFDGSINAETLILGSSKAWVQVSPHIIDSTLETDSYNIGLDGYAFYMQNPLYTIYRKNNSKPRNIIQIVSHYTLSKREDLYQFQKYLPWLRDSIISSVTQDYQGLTYLDYTIPAIRYTGLDTLIRMTLFEGIGIKEYPSSKYKGYLPQPKSWDDSFKRFTQNNPNGITTILLDSSITLFESFIKQSKSDSINLFLVYPPTYQQSHKYILQRKKIIQYYDSIAQLHNVQFLNYSNHKVISQDTTFFYNSQHLNQKGAELFSNILATDIKKLQLNARSITKK